MTCGVRLKPGAQFTMPSTLTTRFDGVETAELGSQHGEVLQSDEPRCVAGLVDVEVTSDLADHDAAVWADRTGTRQEQQVTRSHRGDVHAGRRERRGQFDSELGQSFVGRHGRRV